MYIYIYIHTRVKRALRARIGPWTQWSPPLGPRPWALPWAHPWALVGPCGGSGFYGGPAGMGPAGALGPSGALPWTLPWTLGPLLGSPLVEPCGGPGPSGGPCGDWSHPGPLQIHKTYCFQRPKTFTIANQIFLPGKRDFQSLKTTKTQEWTLMDSSPIPTFDYVYKKPAI